MTDTYAQKRLTQDAFLGGQVTLYQPETGHRVGSDAVFLAACITPKPHQRLLDVGGGVGALGLLILHRAQDQKPFHVTSLDIDPWVTHIAQRNAVHLDQESFFTSVCQDLQDFKESAFDQVISNPPFYDGSWLPPDPQRALARHAQPFPLARWIELCLKRLKPGGIFTFISPPACLGDFFAGLGTKGGGVHILPLYPRQGDMAKRLIVQGRKASKAPLKILPGLVLHEAHSNLYTPNAAMILKEGKGLNLGSV